MFGHPLQRGGLPFHHVRVKCRRPAHGLARVVDDEIEAAPGLQHLAAERLDTRRVPQVEPEDFETIAPLAKVGLARVSRCRVSGKTGRDDEVRARPKQLETGLVADLHAPARYQRHPAAKIGELGALGKIQLRAGRAHLVVEMMDLRVPLLADVAVFKFLDIGPAVRRRSLVVRELGRDPRKGFVLDVLLLEAFRRKDVRRVKNRFLPERADARFGTCDLGLLHAAGLAFPCCGLGHPPALCAVGTVDEGDRLQQALPVRGRYAFQHGPIRGDRFEQFDRLPKAFHLFC